MAEGESASINVAPYDQQLNERKERRRIIIILICCILLAAIAIILFVPLHRYHSASPADAPSPPPLSDGDPFAAGADAIGLACNSSIYPSACNQSLNANPGARSALPLQLVIFSARIAFNATAQYLAALRVYEARIVAHPNVTTELDNTASKCVALMQGSLQRLNISIAKLEQLKVLSLTDSLQEVRAQLRSAASGQQACEHGAVEDTLALAMLSKRQNVTELIVSTLCLVQLLSSPGFDFRSWGKTRGRVCERPSLPPTSS